MSSEFQLQTVTGDQNQRAPVTGVSGELAVDIDIGETQAPGKVLSGGGLTGDFEGDPASIPPGHGPIGFVFSDQALAESVRRVLTRCAR